jgi:DNA polymerase III subunit delta
MKIAFKAVDAFLAKPEAQCRAVLVYGPDLGLVRERAGRIKKTVLAGNDDPFAYVELTEAILLDDPARLADELSAMSLMGGKRLILIRDAGDKLTKIIEGVSAFFHDQVFLVVMGDELPSRSSLRALFDKEPQFASLACYRDEARDVAAVIRKTFEEAGVNADRDAVEYLTGQLGNDRYVTRQELEKIIVYAGGSKRLSLEEAEALVDYNRDTGLDDIVSAVADKNLVALEQMLTVQIREGNQPVSWLRALQRYFNRLYAIRAQMATGRSAGEVIAGLRPPVFFKQVPVLTRHAEQWDSHQIIKALKLLIEAELACKTSDLPILATSHRKLMRVTQVR